MSSGGGGDTREEKVWGQKSCVTVNHPSKRGCESNQTVNENGEEPADSKDASLDDWIQ